jgi:hypothetical protein
MAPESKEPSMLDSPDPPRGVTPVEWGVFRALLARRWPPGMLEAIAALFAEIAYAADPERAEALLLNIQTLLAAAERMATGKRLVPVDPPQYEWVLQQMVEAQRAPKVGRPRALLPSAAVRAVWKVEARLVGHGRRLAEQPVTTHADAWVPFINQLWRHDLAAMTRGQELASPVLERVAGAAAAGQRLRATAIDIVAAAACIDREALRYEVQHADARWPRAAYTPEA